MMRWTNPMNEPDLLFERWANFYLLMAEAAAALIGLLFVVITLAAERRLSATAKIPIYLTPTAIYFASVLFLAALLTFPNHTRPTTTLCVGLLGLIGLIYTGSFFFRRSIRNSYYDPLEWIPYAAFPFTAYVLVVSGGVLCLRDPKLGLTLVAAGMLSLLAVAIRNSWAIAIEIVSTPPGRQ
jgi:uncharacterized SAM-binding protein YcdF (DUF218 family)